MSGFQLRLIGVTGPGKALASIEFSSGLNVISGVSNTGKSYVFELIDFMLGGRKRPRPIPESVGYDAVHAIIETTDGRRFQLSRALQGGEFLLEHYNGKQFTDPVPLIDHHVPNNDQNISSFLLRLTDLAGKRVRKNAANQLQDLSFRNLAQLVLVDEQSIIKTDSPIFGTQATTHTVEGSVFRVLLTGLDDSALVPSKNKKIAKAEIEAQIKILDQLIADSERKINESMPRTPSLLFSALDGIDAQLSRLQSDIERERAGVDEQDEARKIAWLRRDKVISRKTEIAALLERFDLLDRHYASDLERLIAVAEAGYFFNALSLGNCPLCGAAPEFQHHHDGVPSDGDIEQLRSACNAEIEKIRVLQAELHSTVTGLHEEQLQLNMQFSQAEAAYRAADERIQRSLSPAIAVALDRQSTLIRARDAIVGTIDGLARIDELRNRRAAVEASLQEPLAKAEGGSRLPRSVTDAFAEEVTLLLREWRFPLEHPVVFDDATSDIIVDERRRGEQGKGLRALTHAAFNIGLLLTCRRLSRPHPGFVVLDSPLVTLRETDPSEEQLSEQARLDVKHAFYDDLSHRIVADQVIIIENDDPDPRLAPFIRSHIFTKRVDTGRYGFFPT